MRAAQLVEPYRFDVRDVPEPEPGPDEVLVRVEGCGVCGSNLPPWRGAADPGFPLDPGAPGHEAWGTVVAGGGGNGAPGPGTRVSLLSHRAFAELDVVPRDRLVSLPAGLRDAEVPGEPLACAVNVARRAGVREGDTVVVLGVGFLGALLLPLLREAEPAELVAVSRRRTSRTMGLRVGADEVRTYDEIEEDLDGGAEGRADVVIEATGEQRPLDLAGRLCRVRGRLVIAGYHQDGPRTVDLRLWNWRGLDVVNAHERDPAVCMEGMRRGIELLASGRLPLEKLITHRVPLREIERAFRLADERREGFFKAVVLPRAEG